MKDPDRRDWYGCWNCGRHSMTYKVWSWTSLCAENRWTRYFCLLYVLCRKLRYNLVVLSNYAPRGRSSGRFLSEEYWPWLGRICKCLGANARGFPGVNPAGWLLISALMRFDMTSSSETQGQLVGAGKSLNGREKNSGEEKSRMARRAVLDFSSPNFFFSSEPFLTFLLPIFFLFRLDFFPLSLIAPGSPRMIWPLMLRCVTTQVSVNSQIPVIKTCYFHFYW